MGFGEFKLIDRFFAGATGGRDDVILGVGDDAALLKVPPGHELVAATDTVVSGVHFPPDLDPHAIGYRALAVNLSDMVAMGAEPAWCTLALTLSSAEEKWLESFSRGLLELAARHRVALVGGDTTSGPLTITIQIMGFVPAGTAIRRSGARPGDIVCVSGSVGDATAGLRLLTPENSGSISAQDRDYLVNRFMYPTPRVELGQMLRGVATAAIDVSDGLYADLGKLTAASGVGARLEVDDLPLSAALKRYAGEGARMDALQGGDDYELCFTVPPARLAELQRATLVQGVAIQAIGAIETNPGVRCYASGHPLDLKLTGFDHFAR